MIIKVGNCSSVLDSLDFVINLLSTHNPSPDHLWHLNYLKKHNVKDWLRVIASIKDCNLHELRYFNIAEKEGEEED